MRKFASSREVYAAQLPDWQHKAVAEAMHTMEGIFGKDFDPARGYVAMVEEKDALDDADRLLGYPLGSKIENSWRRHGCFVALVIWGNSGDGVSIICPEKPGYAEDIQTVLRSHM